MSEGLASNTKLTDFFFTHNDLQEGGEGGKSLLRALGNKKDLKTLALNSCNLNGSYLEELQKAIAGNTELKELYLFANKIGEEEASFISSMIRNKTKLTSLGLSNNRLCPRGAVQIA